MTLIDSIIAILVAGVKAVQQPDATAATTHAYSRLKTVLHTGYPALDLLALERRPDSPVKQQSLAEDLAESGALTDPSFLAAVSGLAQVIAVADSAEATVIGVDLARVQAAALTLTDIAGDDMAVRLRDSEFSGDVQIHRAQAGNAETPRSTGAPTIQLIGNSTRDLHIGNKTYIGNESNALNLDKVERSYLHGLYIECNELPLANDGPVDAARSRQPRLQHVFVDLSTHVTHSRGMRRERRANLDTIPSWASPLPPRARLGGRESCQAGHAPKGTRAAKSVSGA